MIYAIAVGFIALIALVLWRGEFYHVGPAYLKLGKVSRKDNPVAYWAFMFFFAFLAVSVFGLFLLIPKGKL